MNEVITIGLDLAKNVFQVHGVDASGRPDGPWGKSKTVAGGIRRTP